MIYSNLSAIVCISKNQVIDNQGELPWPKITSDFKWFRQNTINKTVTENSLNIEFQILER
jgi:dihydrofolate reductase